VRMGFPDGTCNGLFLVEAGELQQGNFTSGAAISDLNLIGMNGLGSGISIGQVLGLRIDRVRSVGAYRGIESMNAGASYRIKMRDLDLYGDDCGLYCNSQVLTLDGLEGSAGNCLVRFAGGCDATVGNVYCASFRKDPSAVFEILTGQYATHYDIAHVGTDNEAPPAQPILTAEMSNGFDTFVAISDVSTGMVAEGTPVFRFTNPYPASGAHGYYEVSRAFDWFGRKPVTIQAGPGWQQGFPAPTVVPAP
jgi:hypothetical protein